MVDAADKAHLPVHHDLTVHAPQHVQPLAQNAPPRVKNAEMHSGGHQTAHKLFRQVGRAKAVHQHMHFHATLRGAQQRCVQLLADLVFKQDEGLQHHLVPGVGNCIEHAGEEFLAVLQQFEVVARHPAGGARCKEGAGHSRISAARGAWSESWSQGLRGSSSGACTAALRT